MSASDLKITLVDGRVVQFALAPRYNIFNILAPAKQVADLDRYVTDKWCTIVTEESESPSIITEQPVALAAAPSTPREYAAAHGCDWKDDEPWHDFVKRNQPYALESVWTFDERAKPRKSDKLIGNESIYAPILRRIEHLIDDDGHMAEEPKAAAPSVPSKTTTAHAPSKSEFKFHEVIGKMVPVAEFCEPCCSHRKGKTTGVWTYLLSKSLNPELLPDSVQRCGYVYSPSGALVGVATDDAGVTQAVDLVMLTRDGELADRFGDNSGKLKLTRDKGWFKSSAAVRMPARNGDANAPIVLAEGTCTALAIWQSDERLEVWSTLGVERIGLVPVPAGRDLIIAADYDDPDGDGAKALKRGLAVRMGQRSFKLCRPAEPGTDFCDMHAALGPEAVREVIDAADVIEQKNDDATKLAASGGWPGGLNQFKNVMSNLRNTKEAVLRLDLDCRYNAFIDRYIVHGRELDNLGGDLNDPAIRALRMIIAERYGFEPHKELVEDVIALACHARTFHPVKDWLDALPAWDGTPRIDRLLIDYLGAKDTPLNRAYGRKTMCGLIARIKNPGIKFDSVLTLNGPQGMGKTMFCSDLAGGDDYYADVGILADSSREAMEQFAGKWVIEIGELAGYGKSTLERIKSFITKPFDRTRGVWKHFAQDYRRTCIFIATKNPGGFLNDPTGERRWWIVEVVRYAMNPGDGRDQFLRDRDQLFAEALVAMQTEKLFLDTHELRDAQAGMAFEYKEPNELVDVLSNLKGFVVRTKDGKLEQRISNAMVRARLDLADGDLIKAARNASKLIAEAMAHLHWRKTNKPMTIEPRRAVERGYWRPIDPARVPNGDDDTALALAPSQPLIPGLAPPGSVQDYGDDAGEVPAVDD